jgi:hypothetical protein
MSANPTPARADPLAILDDLADFAPVSSPKPKPAPELVRQVSEASNFPSRAPSATPKIVTEPAPRAPQRRHRTGRNVQLNMKVTAATAERFSKLSDAQGWVFGDTLARALDALEASLASKG